MTTLKIIKKVPPSDGWLETKLSKSVMKRLESYIEVAKKDSISMNDTLVGNISTSLEIKDKDNWFFETILVPLIIEFLKTWPSYESHIAVLTEDAPFSLAKVWVNFQKENEFNPPHKHEGAFSFVIWVKIPTDWREQHALPISANSNAPKASNFQFHYTSMLGNNENYSYFLDKESEGKMLFFPAKLTHSVHPFYNCDKERISISGNVCFDISKNSMNQYRSYMEGKNDQK